jgi:ribosomal-protein-alanine N-acetyltransferase
VIVSWLTREDAPVVRGEGLLMRPARNSDFRAWRDLRAHSREFLRPYEPRWSNTDLSSRAFYDRVRRNRAEAERGTDYSLFIFQTDGGTENLTGGLTLSNVRRRAFQSVTLGYWMGAEYAGKGIMTRAVHAILPFVFEDLALHRIEAACLPDNERSRRVLEKNGFKTIGQAEKYLQIDGEWRDHVLFALTREHFPGQP